MSDLSGRVALVTGANHGIGAAIAVELARLGADVAVSYFELDEPADSGRPVEYGEQRGRDGSGTLAAVEALGRRAVALRSDLADPDAPAQLFEDAEAALGPVEILVHNASGWRKDTFLSDRPDGIGRATDAVTAESFDVQFLVDARAGALLIAQLADRVRSRGGGWGRIVTMTSGGPMGFPGEVSYGAAKAALVNYTMSAALELGREGITANVVHPPVTDTGWVTDDVREFVSRSMDHFHVARPEDVAEVVAWLCTDVAKYVTGNIVQMR